MANKTRAQLNDEVFVRLGETTGYYTATQVNAWLVDGVDDIARRVEPLIQPATTSTVVGQIEYALPNDHIAPHYVFVKHPDTAAWQSPLQWTTYRDLFHANPSWEDAEGVTPTHWYWRDCVIGITPKPTEAVVDGLRMVYSRRPAPMAADPDTTGLADWLDPAVVLYALYRAYSKDRDSVRADLTHREYLDTLRLGGQKLHQLTKDTAPRMIPSQSAYRQYYSGRRSRVRLEGD